ncbi:MAG: hypothetical protein EBZ89_13820 [Chloroflexi bacterium]|nr:hypothetical protein [Chloroflexota bacterium]
MKRAMRCHDFGTDREATHVAGSRDAPAPFLQAIGTTRSALRNVNGLSMNIGTPTTLVGYRRLV